MGKLTVRAHAAPPETGEEFVATSREAIREVFGSGPFDVSQTRIDAPMGETEYRNIGFNLSREYLRAVAKLAFHYFLWACPRIGGDEPEFEAMRRFVSAGIGDEREFLQHYDGLVDRSRAKNGTGPDCHMFAVFANDRELVTTVHFFSQPVGPEFPSFGVRLGIRPETIPVGWGRGHIAHYSDDIPGHAGELRELCSRARPAWLPRN